MKHKKKRRSGCWWKRVRIIRVGGTTNACPSPAASTESVAPVAPSVPASSAAPAGRTDARDMPAATAVIYKSELDYISRCILDYPNIETGGQLFGFWSASGVPVVVFAIGPGARANHQVAFFNQDLDYLTKLGRMLVGKYGLQHMGEWHSHHRLGLSHPSGHDADTMVNSIRRGNLGRFLLCIGNCDRSSSVLNAFTFTQSAGYDYRHAAWRVIDFESPFRTVISSDEEVGRVVLDPRTLAPNHGRLFLADGGGGFVTPDYSEDYWLKNRANNLVLKKMMDDLSASVGPCSVQKDAQQRVHLSVRKGKEYRFVFPMRFPQAQPLVFVDGIAVEPPPDAWSFTDDIAAAFARFSARVLKSAGKTEGGLTA